MIEGFFFNFEFLEINNSWFFPENMEKQLRSDTKLSINQTNFFFRLILDKFPRISDARRNALQLKLYKKKTNLLSKLFLFYIQKTQ